MDIKPCLSCGGEAFLMGVLGYLAHYRCRACGAQFSVKLKRRVRKNSKSGVREADVDGFAQLSSGMKAHYISPVGNYGPSRTGMTVVQFALFRAPGKAAEVSKAKVMYANGKTLEGLAQDVLPESVLRVVRGGGRVYLPGHDKKIRLWGISKGVSANRGSVNMKRKNRRNPHAVDVAWTGKKADYISPSGFYGSIGYSELAMHTGGAGKVVRRFALWKRPASERGPRSPKDGVNWAQVEYESGKVLDGTPHEVLPAEVLRILGRGDYATPRIPGQREKIALWALGRGVAVNKGRQKNPLTKGETRAVLRAARVPAASARHQIGQGRAFQLGRVHGMAMVAEYYGKGNDRKRAARMRGMALRLADPDVKAAKGDYLKRGAHGFPAGHRKNVGSSHPIWKASNLTHKFMSKLDLSQLRIWRDVPLRSVLIGGVEAMGAYRSSVRTVQGRMEEFATALQGIDGLRNYKTLLDAPLRAVAGSFGLQEMLRSDF